MITKINNQEEIRFTTEEEQSLFCGPKLADQMPVEFDNGACYEGIGLYCINCGVNIFHTIGGKITRLGPAVVRIEGIGLCDECNVHSVYDFRVYDDGHVLTMIDGKWVRAERSLHGETGFAHNVLRHIYTFFNNFFH